MDKKVALDNILHNAVKGSEKYINKEGFKRVFVPHLVGVTGACENIDTMFKVPYWGKTVFTAQTGQLYLELKTQIHEKVWCWLQSMRAEPESDGRHLTEFPLLEIEFQGDLDKLINHLNNIIKFAVKEVVTNCPEELATYGRNIEELKNTKFKRKTYEQAIKILKKNGFLKIKFGDDLKREHEAKLTEILGPVFITHYPLEIKFFNMKQNNLDDRVVNSVDMLLPYSGESAGAAERETEYRKIYDRLVSSHMYSQLTAQGLTINDFEWYLEAHRDKTIPLHCGAGIGFARVMQFILGIDDIRGALPYSTDAKQVH